MARHHEHVGIALKRLRYGAVGRGLCDGNGDIFVAATLPKWYLHSGFIDLLAKWCRSWSQWWQRRGAFGEVGLQPTLRLLCNCIWSVSLFLLSQIDANQPISICHHLDSTYETLKEVSIQVHIFV